MAILSDTKARNIKPDSPQLAHGGITGLVLIPSKSKGHGKWVLRFISPTKGKRRNAGLGSYPDLTIAEAGRQANAMCEQLAAGIDPFDAHEEVANAPEVMDFERTACPSPCRTESRLEKQEALPAMDHYTSVLRFPGHRFSQTG